MKVTAGGGGDGGGDGNGDDGNNKNQITINLTWQQKKWW
jgi:hypothetical protein